MDVLGKFYTGFDKMLTKAEKDMEGKRVKIPDEPTDIVCDKCGKLACSCSSTNKSKVW